MTKPKDWTQRVIRRFKDGASVLDLAMEFNESMINIEGIIRRAMQLQEEDF